VSHPPRIYPSYVSLLSSIIDAYPYRFEEANAEQVWNNSMVEKYNSILNNEVWKLFQDKWGNM